MRQHLLEGSLKCIFLGPTPEYLIQQVWAGTQEFAFLASSQALLMLLVKGPHFENH